MIPSTGRIVHYRLSASDVGSINHERLHNEHAHGNPVRAGDVVAMVIVKTWNGDAPATETQAVQGQLLLDGNHTLWVTSRQQGDGEGQWFEPPRVHRRRDPHLIPDTTGDVEPTVPGETTVPVRFSPGGLAEITGDGILLPKGVERVQLVKQANGAYGLRFVLGD